MALLSIDDLHAGYEGSDVLRGVSMEVLEGSVVSLIGPNGAGKTTTLRAVVGLVTPAAGEVRLRGEEIAGLAPHEVYARGVTLVREDRGIFPDLTVEENLRVPVVETPGASVPEIYETFPELETLRSSKGEHLSGGEAQILAIARALRRTPELLLLDEPTEGLAPAVTERLVSVIADLVDGGTTVVLVEQNVGLALSVATSVYLMDGGRIVMSGTAAEMGDREAEIRSYLGLDGR